ncbi:MAG TPA: restriction endonuclease [Solirubrobacterales bacterium]|nr:restriction endonuclease [Solirubrobacterales bacterium]
MRALTVRDLEDLGDERFEDLVAALVLARHPEAEHLGGKDGGADVLLERPDAAPKAWQVKHYPRTVHWEHCIESLDSVVKKHGTEEVVFVFPRKMSQVVKKTFREKLNERHAGVDVSYLGGPQVIAQLREKDESFIEEFFGPDPRNQALAVAEHLEARGLQVTRRPGGDPIIDRLELADAAGRRDRHFRTEVAVTTGDAPQPVWAEPPVMVVTQASRDRTLRIAAWPETDDNAVTAELEFPDGEEGIEARWELTQMLASRGEAELPDGVSVPMKGLPEAVRAVSEEPKLTNLVFRPTHAQEVKLTGELDGKLIERKLELVYVPPRDELADGEVISEFARFDGALAFFLRFCRSGERLALDAQLDLHLTEPENLQGALEAARLLIAWDKGTGTIEIPGFASLGSIPIKGGQHEDRAPEYVAAAKLFEDLITIRDAVGITGFEVGDEVLGTEAEAASIAAKVIRTGSGYYRNPVLTGEFTLDEMDELKRHEEGPSVARFPIDIEVFGKKVGLGIAEAEVPKPTSVEVVDGLKPSTRRFEMKWKDAPALPFKVISKPDSQPTQFGIWLPGEQPA